MRVTILDDYQDCVRTLHAFALLAGHEVTVLHGSEADREQLVRRLAGTEALVLIRERTRLDRALLEQLPDLRMVSRIGRQVARYGQAFGMRVVVWGGPASTAAAVQDGFELAANRQAFFAESDVVSLHLRFGPRTQGIVTAADLQAMKTSALLVNTSR